ncbi:MAG: hypothetical protein U0324_26045 [Polyangiales bacterium]
MWGVAFAAAHLAACSGGERARNGCPPGETCAAEIPGGLSFEATQFGPGFSWWAPPPPIAVGGALRIALVDRVTHQPLAVPFAAQVTGAALSVSPLGGGAVQVRAVAPGEGYLRIVTAAGDRLIDRVALRAVPVAAFSFERTDGGPFFELRGTPPTLVVGPGDARFTVALRSSDGEPLVDDGFLAEVPAGTGVRLDQPFWNVVIVHAPAARTSPLTLTTSDGAARAFSLRVSSAAGEIVALPPAAGRNLDAAAPVPFPQGRYCFGVMFEGALAGAGGWHFRAAGPHRVVGEDNCATVTLADVGGAPFTLTASAGTLSQSFVLTPGY